MLIDLFSSCATIAKCTYYDYANAKLFTNNFSVKSFADIKSLKIINPIKYLHLTFIVSETKSIKDITYELKGYTPFVKILTSIDYINWYELPYKRKKFGDKYLYKESASGTFFNVDLNTYETNIDNIDLEYSFTKSNKFNNTITDIYDNYEFKFIRFQFDEPSINDVNNPIYFSDFKIMIEDNFNEKVIDNNLLELKANMYTQQKIFEEEMFIPDVIKNYLKMIEEKTDSISDVNYVTVAINDNTLNFSPDEGIEFDFVGADTLVY